MVTRPALDPAEVEPRSSSGYPQPFRERVLPREKRALGAALGRVVFTHKDGTDY